MKKKVIAVFLVLTVLLSMVAVAGCGSDSSSDGKTEIEIIQYKMEATDYFDALEKEFNETHDDIHLTIDSPNDASTIMKTRFIREDYPDIIGIGGDINYSYYVDAEILADLSDWDGMSNIKEAYLDIAEALEFVPTDGTYIAPYMANAAGILYNKDMFDAAGLEYPQADWTWDDLLTAAQALTKDGVYGFYAPVTYNELYKVVAQNGGALFDEDGNPTIDSAENVEALQWMLDKMLKYHIQPTSEEMSGKTPEDMFKNSEIAMEVTGSWMVTTFADAPFEWDIALEPGNTDQVHHVFADGIVASADTKNAEAAWKLIKFLSTDPTAAKIRLDSSWDLPATNDESVQEQYTSQEKPEHREVIFEAMETGIMPPVVDHYAEVQNAINEQLNRAVIGQQSAEDALKAAQEEVTNILK